MLLVILIFFYCFYYFSSSLISAFIIYFLWLIGFIFVSSFLWKSNEHCFETQVFFFFTHVFSGYNFPLITTLMPCHTFWCVVFAFYPVKNIFLSSLKYLLSRSLLFSFQILQVSQIFFLMLIYNLIYTL